MVYELLKFVVRTHMLQGARSFQLKLAAVIMAEWKKDKAWYIIRWGPCKLYLQGQPMFVKVGVVKVFCRHHPCVVVNFLATAWTIPMKKSSSMSFMVSACDSSTKTCACCGVFIGGNNIRVKYTVSQSSYFQNMGPGSFSQKANNSWTWAAL